MDNPQLQEIGEVARADIVAFKKQVRDMRTYFLHGVNYNEIDAQALSKFEDDIRAFIAKVDDWEQKHYTLHMVFNTPGQVMGKMKDARRKIFRARNLVNKKSRTEKEDNELIDKYELLFTICNDIFEKIRVEID